MTSLRIAINKHRKRKDGSYIVYIRITHWCTKTQKQSLAWLRTDKMVTDRGITKDGEVIDPVVLAILTERIEKYRTALNKVDNDRWDAKQVADFLSKVSDDVCFSDYARQYIDKIYNDYRDRTARNYTLALQHLERFMGTNKIMFSQLSSTTLNAWIKTLLRTKRSKEMYPVCMRVVFKNAVKELNDEELGIKRIKFNPWNKVQIPQSDTTQKLAISPEDCRRFFAVPLKESRYTHPKAEIARDVAMLSFGLAGMNTIDIYNLKKTDFNDGIISYYRAKTKKARADNAYMEMRIPQLIMPLIEKYKQNDPKDDYLLTFHKNYSNSDSFGANINAGLKDVCAAMGIKNKSDMYCAYTFRHTWATIARNEIGARIDDVAFALNHSSAHRVTRGYIKTDFSPAWELNEKVLDFIFFSNESTHRKQVIESNSAFERFSCYQLMKGEVFFRGTLLGEITDTGFNNVDSIIDALSKFIPETIPERTMLSFRITNMDKHQTAVYQHMKGGRV